MSKTICKKNKSVSDAKPLFKCKKCHVEVTKQEKVCKPEKIH